MADEIVLEVPGQPVPQPRHKVAVRRGTPHAYIEAKHPIHAYRAAIQLIASAAKWPKDEAPYVVLVECIFARPPSHWRKAGLASSAPLFPPKCDWDNLGKGVCDAIQGSASFWIDDEQIVDGRTTKRYASRREAARTVIRIRRV